MKIFGRLTVKEHYKKAGTRWLLCDCACGKTVDMPSRLWRDKRSCGCLVKENKSRVRAEAAAKMQGQVFGRLTAVSVYDYTLHGPMWQCKCSCGNMKLVLAAHLKGGKAKSCGCLMTETRKINGSRAMNTKWRGGSLPYLPHEEPETGLDEDYIKHGAPF